MLLDDGGEKFLNGLVKVLAGFNIGFEFGGDEIEALSDDGVEDGIGARNIGAGTDGAELEFIAGEGKRTGSVSVAGIRGSLGSMETPVSKIPPCLLLLAGPFSICSKMSVSCSPRKTEMIAGGASLAPRR